MTQEGQNNPQILLVESDKENAELTMRLLRDAKEFPVNVAHAANLNKGMEVLRSEKFDAVLLNLSLSDSGGLYSLQKVLAGNPDLSVIVINGVEDDDLALQCVHAGAQTYLLKGQVGTRGLIREIRFAIQRNARLHVQVHSSKINSMAEMAKDFGSGLQRPLTSIKEKLSELRNIVSDPALDRKRALELLGETEEISRDVQGILSELKLIAEDMSPNDSIAIESRNRCQILVCDDEPEIVDMLVRRLKKIGYANVDTASNGQEGYNLCIQKLQKGIRYDTIVSDWKMPKLTGIEFLTKIRENAHLKDTPFLMVTALDEVDFVKEAISMKVSQYLVKPFQPEEFDRKIGYLTRRSKM